MNYYFKAFQNYATFSGRARRSEFWYFFLFHVIALGVLGGINGLTGSALPYTIYALAALIPYFAVATRRMHDIGKSGWFLMIPIYNIVLLFTEGDQGSNIYGADPKPTTSLEKSNVTVIPTQHSDPSYNLNDLGKLHELFKAGAITQEEFDQQKQKVLKKAA